MSLEKYLGFDFSSGVSNGDDYLKFQKDAKKEIKKIVSSIGYSIYKFIPNHYEFSCVLKKDDTEDYSYISISDVRYFPDAWYYRMLVRKMRDSKDFCGLENHFCKFPELGNALLNLR